MALLKLSNERKLYWTYVCMCLINLTIILYIASLMYITTQRICDMNEARTFLSTISQLPKNPVYILITSLTCFPGLLLLMYFRRVWKLSSWKLIVCFLFELCLCMLIMNALSFSTNAILLLVMADLLSYVNTNTYRLTFLASMIALYLVANYDVLSGQLSMVSFSEYISCYNSGARSLFMSIQNILTSLNIIIFIVYMIILVQDKINESKRFLQMNEELKDLNDQLKEYANIREKMGETRERNRLAREIHDTLGHTLTGLSVGLDACVVTSDINPDATKAQLEKLSKTARQGLKDVRRSVDKLRPDALEQYTLKDAIDKMIQEFTSVTDIKIHFVCHLASLVFEKDEEEVIYRIIQEGMTNSVRHGNAKKIFISIAKEARTLILLIEDDGKGCDNIKPDFGLHHMKERVELLQGTIRFYGVNGFVIIAEIPIREGI